MGEAGLCQKQWSGGEFRVQLRNSLLKYKDTVKVFPFSTSLSFNCVCATCMRLDISLTVIKEAEQRGSAVSQGYPHPAA